MVASAQMNTFRVMVSSNTGDKSYELFDGEDRQEPFQAETAMDVLKQIFKAEVEAGRVAEQSLLITTAEYGVVTEFGGNTYTAALEW